MGRTQVRASRAQRDHIGMAIRASLRLERHVDNVGGRWYEVKARIYRDAVRACIAGPEFKMS